MKVEGGHEGRKLQSTGGSTLIVSLPKSWTIANKLGKGDPVFFHPQADGALTLYPTAAPASRTAQKTCLISNTTPHDHLFRRLVAEYIAGAPLLEVRTQDRMNATTRKVVREFAQRVIGPEILEESADRVVLQEMAASNPLPLPSVIRRMHPMAHAMQKDAMAAFTALDASIARDVVDRDWEIDRLHWFVHKTVTTAMREPRTLAQLQLTAEECLTYLSASRVLERIADHAVRIAEVTGWVEDSHLPSDAVDELAKLSETSLELLDRAVATLFTGKTAEANAVIDAVESIANSRQKWLERFVSRKGKVAVALAYVLESVERTALYTSDLAEIAMNHAVCKESTA